MQPSKFKAGHNVIMSKPNLYDETKGVITKEHRVFKAFNERTGRFEPGGLCIIESDLKTFSVPYEVIGDTLKVMHPETEYETHIQKACTYVYKLHHWSYTIKSEKISSVYPERLLSLQ